MQKNILVLTSVYPAKHSAKGTTPVVHYFAKEWARIGHHVHVIHIGVTFPFVYYYIGRLLKDFLYSKLGFAVPVTSPKEYEEDIDGVTVSHITMRKIIPHGRFSQKQILSALNKINSIINKEGVPDYFVGHWDNPQLDLLYLLKQQYGRPTCLVFHNNDFSFLSDLYGSNAPKLLKNIDSFGFRNLHAKTNFEKIYGKSNNSFIAASGVSKPFIEAGESYHKSFSNISKYIYVGALIERKYPATIVRALSEAYADTPFEMTYIGNGNEIQNIKDTYNNLRCKGNLHFTGKIPRETIIEHLQDADVFVMISSGEVFGLVYLEAMALGCITIAARNEGIDGIIEDGVNGFLCEAGNVQELSVIINKIRRMSPKELKCISDKAKETALRYTDSKVAEYYLQQLYSINR